MGPAFPATLTEWQDVVKGLRVTLTPIRLALVRRLAQAVTYLNEPDPRQLTVSQAWLDGYRPRNLSAKRPRRRRRRWWPWRPVRRAR